MREARTSMIACSAAVWRTHFAIAVRSLWALGSRHDRSSSQMASSSSWILSFSHEGSDAWPVGAEAAFCTSWNRRSQTRSPNRLASVDSAEAAGDHNGRRFTLSWAAR